MLSAFPPAFFITGTDTGVGKSIFSAFLALAFSEQGKKVAISKPIQTGEEKDTDLLKSLTGNKIDVFNTYSFKLPAAPIVAARYENKEIDVEKIISDVKSLEDKYDVVIVEGIGGIAVPIVNNVIARSVATKQSQDVYLVADLIKDLDYPAVVVCRSSLGTINHSVLTIEFANKKNLNLLGFVISGYDENTSDPMIKTAPEIISEMTKIQCIMKLSKVKNLSYESVKSMVIGLAIGKTNMLV